MTLALAAHPEARIEFFAAVDAVTAYAGLEEEFLAEVARISALVAAAPLSFPVDTASPKGHEVRRAKIGRFPWNLLYVARAATVFVIAVAHTRRRPGYWERRLEA